MPKLLVVSHQHQAIWLRSLRQSHSQSQPRPSGELRPFGVGGAGGVDSHLLQLNLACLRGSTL